MDEMKNKAIHEAVEEYVGGGVLALLSSLYGNGFAIVPVKAIEEMLSAARDWSLKKYGQGIGNDAAIGCWSAMLAAAQEKTDD